MYLMDKQIQDSDRCRTALCYTKPWMFSITVARIDSEGNQVTTLEHKKEMVKRVAIPKTPEDLVNPLAPRSGMVHRGDTTQHTI